MISPFPVNHPQTPHPTSALSPLKFASVRVCPHLRTLSRPTAPASSTLRHQTSTGPRASPPIGVRQRHPLLHIYGSSLYIPWLGSTPWEHWVVLPANINLSVVLHYPSAPTVLQPAPPAGSARSV